MTGINEKQKRFIATAAIVVLAALFLFRYLAMTNEEIPLMDFYIGFETFADKVFSNQLTISDCFVLPHPIHWAPLGTPLQLFFLKVFKCNNLAYVYFGGGFLILTLIMVLVWANRTIRSGKLWVDILIYLGIAICMTNLNQWEILDLWCSAAFMLRILLYFLVFLTVDRFLLKEKTKGGRTLLQGLGCGVLGGLVLILLSGAYYPGYIVAISAVIILHVFLAKNEGKKEKGIALIALLIMIGSAAFVYLTTASNAGISDGTAFGTDYLRGFFVMLGSTVIPQSSIPLTDFTEHIVVGVIIFLFVVETVIVFFKDRLYEKSWFPLMCLIYAGTSVAIIIYGRSDSYGFGTLTSSRYVVETTIGLLGIVMIQGMSISKHIREKGTKPAIRRAAGAVIALCVAGMVIYANVQEHKAGPYRKAYYQNMIRLALDIDNASDDELVVFQASASDVRSGIAAMKKYKLCLWAENSKYYQKEEPVTETIPAEAAGNAV